MAVKFGGAVSLINFGRTYVVLISAGSILQNLGLGIDWKSIIYTKNLFFFTIPWPKWQKRINSRFPAIGIVPALVLMGDRDRDRARVKSSERVHVVLWDGVMNLWRDVIGPDIL